MLKVTVKFIIIVNQDVFSTGFPVSVIDDITSRLIKPGGQFESSDNMLSLENVSWYNKPFTNDNYHQWRERQKTAPEESNRRCSKAKRNNTFNRYRKREGILQKIFQK